CSVFKEQIISSLKTATPIEYHNHCYHVNSYFWSFIIWLLHSTRIFATELTLPWLIEEVKHIFKAKEYPTWGKSI
ncbi:hypothetical protein, partial [Virgibacillus sp. DJP39]|uniref:hypothetical protein n=1 Tax=Virgibacillus sp. DJP39 TaxID=3409790 RepID=UPI003BB4AD18